MPSVQCSVEWGDSGCYSLYTKNKLPTKSEQWNRGCCTPKDGSNICPLDGHKHDHNENYDMWRHYCEKDNCNTKDPRTNDGGGSWEGGIVVDARSSARQTWTQNILTGIIVIILGVFTA